MIETEKIGKELSFLYRFYDKLHRYLEAHKASHVIIEEHFCMDLQCSIYYMYLYGANHSKAKSQIINCTGLFKNKIIEAEAFDFVMKNIFFLPPQFNQNYEFFDNTSFTGFLNSLYNKKYIQSYLVLDKINKMQTLEKTA